MIEKSRIFISVSLFLIIATLIFHFTAMGMDRWKIYEHRLQKKGTITIGLFDRCEYRHIDMAPHGTKVYPICDANRYFFYGNTKCSDLTNRIQYTHMQMICSIDNNQCDCSYSSYAKGLIACTIIAACTLGISFILIFSHILINQFNYKIHLYISLITIILLILGFIFILITLILLGATLAYDLFQYRYNLDYQLASSNVIRKNITDLAYNEYDVRLDRGGILEIVALILSSFTLFTQIFYLLFIYRNRMG